jgi:acetyltransferase-like isoleucine patch superfamily enzyme
VARTWPARLAGLPVLPFPVRSRILRRLGHELAPGARIWPGSLVIGSKLSLGRDTFVNGACLIDATGRVAIGAGVHLAPGVRILTTTHELGPPERRAGPLAVGDVTVGDGAWLGAGATILPGVTVGAGAIVAAGAVVESDLAPNGLYGGVPARLIRELE